MCGFVEGLVSIPNLESSICKITGSPASPSLILESLKTRGTLVSLTLSENKLGRAGMAALMSYLSSTKTLETLEISNAKMSDGEVAVLVEGMKQNTTVKELDLSNNDFNSPAGESLAQMLDPSARHLHVESPRL